MNFINFDFIVKCFLLQGKKLYTLKLIVAFDFSLLCCDVCFQSCFFFFFKADLHSTNVSRMTDGKWGFSWQSYWLEELINKRLTK